MAINSFDGLSPENRIDDSILDKISGGSGQMDILDFGDEGSQSDQPPVPEPVSVQEIMGGPILPPLPNGLPRPKPGGLGGILR